jgi:hypothetical protein
MLKCTYKGVDMRLFGIFSVLVLSQLTLASGWDCFGGNYRAKLRNSTTATRTPSVFVVSHRTQGTLLAAKKTDIDKEVLSTQTRYSAFNQGEQLLATLSVKYVEGRSARLEHGEEVDGKLQLEEREGETRTFSMVCRRYLKN